MPLEFDVITGFDFSSLSSVTLAQFTQATNQIAPLSNKGFIIWGNTEPDVINNPRYARYLWINTATTPYEVRLYNGAAWVSQAPGAGGVTNTMIATAAVSLLAADGITYKITRAFNDANDVTKAAFLLRLDANGKRVEIASLATVLAGGSAFVAGVSGLSIGSDNQFLRMNGTTIGWETVTFGNELADGSVPLGKLVSGGVNQLIQVNGSGVPAYVDTINGLTKLEAGTASALQVIRRNTGNTAWEYATPILSKEQTIDDGAGVLVTGATVRTFAFGFTPKIIRAVLRCTTADIGYSFGDEAAIEALQTNDSGASDPDYMHATVILSGSTVSLAFMAASGPGQTTLNRKDTGARAAIVVGSWTPRVYAYA